MQRIDEGEPVQDGKRRILDVVVYVYVESESLMEFFEK